MKKAKRLITILTAAMPLLMLFTGCHADVYYQAQAIERARSYLLQNAKDLSDTQRAHVRYTDPVILHAEALGKSGQINRGRDEHDTMRLTTEQRQICVTWRVPGKEYAHLVYGVSNGRMSDWYPDRIIRRTFSKFTTPLKDMIAKAREYAINNLLDTLTEQEMNQVRFTLPALAITRYSYVPVMIGKNGKPFTPTSKRSGSQYSLIWHLDSRRDVVFSGRCGNDLSKWRIEFAGAVSSEESIRMTESELLTPDNILDELPRLPEKETRKATGTATSTTER